ncbi:hypothetical protein DFQ27_002404 [Actinomortierella ambigua]|uniref:DUF300-domain-containing protein n=1 Tax=Actinomortierella ambigua TaxID=1343610 RepID=A0A9P6QMA6_9FUNG|nr:hypothetical protein DFQ27_002404 [Actinomortierella ambigua]
MAIATSFILIYRHCQYYTNPNQQRYIVRILLMVPIYATTSWFSYVYVRESVYYESIRTLYEAFVVASFFILMLQYLGSTLADQKRVLKTHQRTKRWLFPLCCMKYNPSRLHFLQFMKWGILQYVPLKVFTTFLAIVLEAQGTYCEESWSPKFGHVWVLIIDFTSVSVSTYFLIMFYVTIHKDLKKYQPLLKFLAIKLMVTIEGLVYFNVIKESQYWTTSNIATGLNAFIIDIEMFGFALLHLKAFSYKPYVPRKPIPPKDKSPLGNGNDQDPSSISLSRLGSMENIDLEKNDPRSTATTADPGTRRERRQEASMSSQRQDPPYQKYPDLSSPKTATVASTANTGKPAGYKSRRATSRSRSSNTNTNTNTKNSTKKDERRKDKIVKKSKAPERVPTKAERDALMDYEKTTPVYKGLVDAFNPLDTIREIWYGIRYLYRWSRGLPVDRDHQRLMDLETAFGRLRPEPKVGKKENKDKKGKKDKKKSSKSKKKLSEDGSDDDDEDGDDDDEQRDEKKKNGDRSKNKNKKDMEDSDDDDGSDDGEKKKRRKKKKGDDTDDDGDDSDSEAKSIEDAYTIDDGDSSSESDPDNIRSNPNTPGYATSKAKRQHDLEESPGRSGSGQGGGMTNKERMEEKAKLVVVTTKGIEYLPKEAASRTELAHVPSIKLKPVRKKELLSGLYAAHPHLRTSSGAQQELNRRRDTRDEGRPSSSLSGTRTPEIPMPHPLRELHPRSSLDRDNGLGRGGSDTLGYDPYAAFGTPPFQKSRSNNRHRTQFAHKDIRLSPSSLLPDTSDMADEVNEADDVDTNSSSSMFYHSREASHSDPELHTLTHAASTINYTRHHDQYVEQLERLEKERQLYHFHQQQELWRQHIEQLEQEQLQEQEEAAAAAATLALDGSNGAEVTTEHASVAAATDHSRIPRQAVASPTDPAAPSSASSISPMPDRPPPLPDKDGNSDGHNNNNHPSASSHPDTDPRNAAQQQQPSPQRRAPPRRHSVDSIESGGSIRGGRHDARRRYQSPDEYRRAPPGGEAASFTARKRFYQHLASGQQDQGYLYRSSQRPGDGVREHGNDDRSRSPPSGNYDPRYDRSQRDGDGLGGLPMTRMPYPPIPAAVPHLYHHDHPASYGRPRDDYYDVGSYDLSHDARTMTNRSRYASPPPPPLRLPSSMPSPYGGRGRYGPPPGPPSPETLLPVSRYAPPHLREFEYQQWLEQQHGHGRGRGRGRSPGDGGGSGSGYRRDPSPERYQPRQGGQDPHAPSLDDMPPGMSYDPRPYQPFPNHRDYLPQSSRRDYHSPPPHQQHHDGNIGDRDDKGKAPQRFLEHDLDRRDPHREFSPSRRQYVPYEHVVDMHRYHQDPAVHFQQPLSQQPPPPQLQQQYPIHSHDEYDGPYEEAVIMTRSANNAHADQ